MQPFQWVACHILQLGASHRAPFTSDLHGSCISIGRLVRMDLSLRRRHGITRMELFSVVTHGHTYISTQPILALSLPVVCILHSLMVSFSAFHTPESPLIMSRIEGTHMARRGIAPMQTPFNTYITERVTGWVTIHLHVWEEICIEGSICNFKLIELPWNFCSMYWKNAILNQGV